MFLMRKTSRAPLGRVQKKTRERRKPEKNSGRFWRREILLQKRFFRSGGQP